jgi:hypothetical protein
MTSWRQEDGCCRQGSSLIGGDVAFDVSDADHGAGGMDGEVVDAVAVFVDLALVAEAVGEGRVVQGWCLGSLRRRRLDVAGVGVGGDRWARSRVMRKLRSMTCRRRMMGRAITGEGPLAVAAAPLGMLLVG